MKERKNKAACISLVSQKKSIEDGACWLEHKKKKKYLPERETKVPASFRKGEGDQDDGAHQLPSQRLSQQASATQHLRINKWVSFP